MHTKPGSRPTDPMSRFRAAMRRPHTWHISGIDAFWIENGSGEVLTAEFPDTGPAYEAALRLLDAATDREDVVMVGRRSREERIELTRGPVLLDLAEAHVGLPARARVARE